MHNKYRTLPHEILLVSDIQKYKLAHSVVFSQQSAHCEFCAPASSLLWIGSPFVLHMKLFLDQRCQTSSKCATPPIASAQPIDEKHVAQLVTCSIKAAHHTYYHSQPAFRNGAWAIMICSLLLYLTKQSLKTRQFGVRHTRPAATLSEPSTAFNCFLPFVRVFQCEGEA